MRYTTTADSEHKLDALLDAAQLEPVILKRGQQEVAVIVSTAS